MEHKNLKSSVVFFCVNILKIEGARKYPANAAAIGNNKHKNLKIMRMNDSFCLFSFGNIIFQFPLF